MFKMYKTGISYYYLSFICARSENKKNKITQK